MPLGRLAGLVAMMPSWLSMIIEKDELGRILTSTYYRRVPQLLVDLANDRGGDDNITVVVVMAANEARAKSPSDDA